MPDLALDGRSVEVIRSVLGVDGIAIAIFLFIDFEAFNWLRFAPVFPGNDFVVDDAGAFQLAKCVVIQHDQKFGSAHMRKAKLVGDNRGAPIDFGLLNTGDLSVVELLDFPTGEKLDLLC